MSYYDICDTSIFSFTRQFVWLSQKDCDGNTCTSPLSVYSALSLVLPGLVGKSRDDLLSVFHLPTENDFETVNREVGKALKSVFHTTGKVEAVQANGIFMQCGLHVLESYLTRIMECHDSSVTELNFQEDSPAARLAINQWISSRTSNKINDLLPPTAISKNTRVVLANALYFRGAWRDPFSCELTSVGDFKLSDGTRVNTTFLHGKKKCLYSNMDIINAQLVKLPFNSHELLIALPNADDGLAGMVEKLVSPESDESFYSDIFKRQTYRPCDVVLSLPRFSVDGGNLELEELLSKLGLASLFSASEADFSGINGTRDLVLSSVVHQAKIDIDEEGAEAAAATVAVMNRMAMPMVPNEPVVCTVDHPFLFMILSTRTRYPLFVGTFTKPAAP